MENFSTNSTQILPSGMPFSSNFIADNFSKVPFTLALFSLYVYMVATRKTHQFRYFTHFHVIMYTNIFFIFLWQIFPIIWKFLESIAIFFWIAFMAIFYMGMINQIVLNFVLCQTIFLYFADEHNRSQRGKYHVAREKLIFGGAIILLGLEVFVEVVWKFYRVIGGRTIEFDIPCILSHVIIISLLAFWFSWWVQTGRKARLSQRQVCHLVNSLLFISISTISLIIATISQFSTKTSDEVARVTLPLGTLLFLPFIWTISAFICDFPHVSRIFEPLEQPIVEFNMT